MCKEAISVPLKGRQGLGFRGSGGVGAMASSSAAVFRKHRTAQDRGGDAAWAARVSHKALRSMPETAHFDLEADFELDENDRVVWRLLQLPRRFSDIQKTGILPLEELQACLRALVAADAVEVVDAELAKLLLPAEVKRVRAEVAGKTWRAPTGTLVAKVYRPDIDGRASAAAETSGEPGTTQTSSPGTPPRTTTAAAGPRPAPTPQTTPAAQPAGASPPATGQSGLTAEDRAIHAQLAAAFASLKKVDHYAFLGVTPTADDAAIRAAYVRLARDYHPDRIAGSALAADAEARSWIEALFKRLGDAQKTLMNAEHRVRYDREQKALQSSGTPTSSTTQTRRPVEARNAFIMAETFFKKREFAQAELHYRQAAAFDPEEPAIAVGLAWCMYHNPDHAPEKRRDEARRRLEESLKKFRSGDAAYKLGRVLRDQGDEAGAAKLFDEAARLAPGHVDAQREVRIATMRKEKAEAEKQAENTGLLGKLLRR
jgi:curved DNA-binding protein CbpA